MTELDIFLIKKKVSYVNAIFCIFWCSPSSMRPGTNLIWLEKKNFIILIAFEGQNFDWILRFLSFSVDS